MRRDRVARIKKEIRAEKRRVGEESRSTWSPHEQQKETDKRHEAAVKK